MGKIAGYRVQEDREWQEYDRMTQPGSGSVQAVEDPVGYALSQVNEIEELSQALGEGCEAAMSDEAYKPDVILHRMHDL
jgi:hypothetical protein